MNKLFLFILFASLLFINFGCLTTQETSENTADILDNIMKNWIAAFNNEDSDTLIKYFCEDAIRIRNNADNTKETFNGIDQISEDIISLFEKIDASLFNFEFAEKDLTSNPEFPKYMYIVDLPVNRIEHTFIFKKNNGQWRIVKHILIINVK